MHIRSDHQYKSVLPFSRINLPALTVLIGLNGSGKTQLLEAIQQGSVVVEFNASEHSAFISKPPPPMPGTPPSGVIRLSNGDALPEQLSMSIPTSVATTPPGMGSPGWMAAEHDPMLVSFESGRSSILQQFATQLQRITSLDCSGLLDHGEDIWRLGSSEIAARVIAAGGNPDGIDGLFVQAEQALRTGGRVSETQGNRLAQLPMLPPAFYTAIAVMDRPALSLTMSDLVPYHLWTTVQTFTPPITQVFGRYRDLKLRNNLARLHDEETGMTTALSQDAFVARNGRPPWSVVSEVMAAFALPYRVASPPIELSQPTTFVLLDEHDHPITLADLSSGERILLRFALSLMDYSQVQVGTSLPTLLLLDEMDASLHPEMVNRWLTAITDGLVENLGIHCILATHSPTTVALAPEASLFEMRRDTAGPVKVTKAQALNALTVGLPFLSVDYSGRRQVFAESDTDAETYQLLAAILKVDLALPLTLAFISTGIRKENTEQGTGCAQVRKLTKSLTENGATNVRGVVDWDGRNVETGNVLVLAKDTHYALDNLLTDPFLIGVLMIDEQKPPEGIDANFVGLDKLTQAERQAIADSVLAPLKRPPDADATLVDSKYLDGNSIKLPRFIQTMRGHDLEEALVAAHPVLKKWHHRRGQLTGEIVKVVLRNYPGFSPKPIADLFRKLAN